MDDFENLRTNIKTQTKQKVSQLFDALEGGDQQQFDRLLD